MFEQLKQFEEIWCVDFEFRANPGEQPSVWCMVAYEVRTGRLLRCWRDELLSLKESPFSDRSLFVAYYASAEIGCFLTLGWKPPLKTLDLYVEFRAKLNGTVPKNNFSLLGCLTHHGLGHMTSVDKNDMRDLAMRGGPFTHQERRALMDYCYEDVKSLVELMKNWGQLPSLDAALARGRYMGTVAEMEFNGIPIDRPTLDNFRKFWNIIKREIASEVNRHYNVPLYEGTTFKRNVFEAWIAHQDIQWPLTETGYLSTSGDTFREQSRLNPHLRFLHESRHLISELKIERLYVGADNRNRCLLSPFRSKTSRNQPSNANFIFGPSTWIRSLIKPGPGKAIAYIDFRGAEFGIAAALSKDENLAAAYRSEDMYLAFAKQCKAVPSNATKRSHPDERAKYKVTMLALAYGQSEHGLARSLGIGVSEARGLIRRHKETFTDFWQWVGRTCNSARQHGHLGTLLLWPIRITDDTTERTISNFKAQANCAEILRLSCIYVHEAGIKLCAPIHDAILIEATVDEIGDAVERSRECMAAASRDILGCFELGTDTKIVRYPARYFDDRGKELWHAVESAIEGLSGAVDLPDSWVSELIEKAVGAGM